MLVLTRKVDESITASAPAMPVAQLEDAWTRWATEHGLVGSQAAELALQFVKEFAGSLPKTRIDVVVNQIKGSSVRLGIHAPEDVTVLRTEIVGTAARESSK